MKALEFVLQFHLPPSTEKSSKENPHTTPSKSEIKRWIDQGSILFNGEKCRWDEAIDFPVFSFVIFPKSETKRVTLK